MGELRRRIEALVRLMVDRPDEVEVIESEPGDDGTLFEVWTAPGDLGQVIGRQGRTARALRTLLDARGAVEDRRYDLDLCDE